MTQLVSSLNFKLHIETTPSAAPDAPIFIVGHGLMGSIRSEDDLGLVHWRDLSQRGTVVRFDLRGHGQSPLEHELARHRWDRVVEDLISVMRLATGKRLREGDLPSPRIILIGSSFTSAVILHLLTSATHHDVTSIAGVVLTIPPTGWEHRRGLKGVYRDFADHIRRDGMGPFWSYLCSLPPTPFMLKARPDYRKVLTPHIEAMDPLSMAAAYEASAESDLPERDLIKEIQTPVLLLCRSDDPTHPVGVGEEIARLIPTSELRVATSAKEMKEWPIVIQHWLDRFGL